MDDPKLLASLLGEVSSRLNTGDVAGSYHLLSEVVAEAQKNPDISHKDEKIHSPMNKEIKRLERLFRELDARREKEEVELTLRYDEEEKAIEEEHRRRVADILAGRPVSD